MRNLALTAISFLLLAMFVGCKENKTVDPQPQKDSTVAVPDTTIYGVCTEATSMHMLQIVTDMGDSLTFVIHDEEPDSTIVQGGLMAGDRMAIVSHKSEGEQVAERVLNMTTLLGHWTSLDKNFTIEEGGIVKSNVKAESHPWTSWKIYNGQLLLNTDTFQINMLGADSLFLENDKGIFVYKRQI